MIALAVAGLLACALVAIVGLAAVLGWGGPMTRAQRLGLCGAAAGLVGAGIGRAAQAPVGWFDALFLAGLVLYLAATYGRAIWSRADRCDGVTDGRIRLPRRP